MFSGKVAKKIILSVRNRGEFLIPLSRWKIWLLRRWRWRPCVPWFAAFPMVFMNVIDILSSLKMDRNWAKGRNQAKIYHDSWPINLFAYQDISRYLFEAYVKCEVDETLQSLLHLTGYFPVSMSFRVAPVTRHLGTYLFSYASIYDAFHLDQLVQMFSLDERSVHSTISKMMIKDDQNDQKSWATIQRFMVSALMGQWWHLLSPGLWSWWTLYHDNSQP